MAYAGVIFDLDGVICTTDHYHYLAWKTLADRLGIPFSEEENNQLRGISRLESLNILLRKSNDVYTEAQRLALADEKNRYYQKLLVGMSAAELSAEVKATLDQLPMGHGGIVEAEGRKGGVYKDDTGRCHVVNPRCPHLGCQLEWNPDEKTWDCPCHGSRFAYDGSLIDNPAQTHLQREMTGE